VRPAHGEHGRRGQADQAGQADGERGADQLRHRAAGQDAEALDGVQAGLGDAERAGPGVGAQDRTASQPIILIRADGVAILLITKAPITMPRGTAAISSPTVSALPCRERA
jgi:hypothetical protein